MSELVDKDAFLKQERKWYCENCDRRKGVKNGRKCFVYEIGEVPCRACDVDDVLDDLECFETIDAPRWVRVEELPTIGQNVLTMDADDDMEIATYDGEGFFRDSYGNCIRHVLYWMPLPEPPKEDA